MPRRALLLSVALAGMLGCADAWAARTTVAVPGEVQSFGRAGDAIVIARRTAKGGVVVERRTPDSAVQRLLRLPRVDDDSFVAVAASSEAVAVSVHLENNERGTSSKVLVGPPLGPLREVTSCADGYAGIPVAVSGPRIAWTEGGCLDIANATVSPLSIAIGGADAAAPVRRIAVAGEAVASAIVLTDDMGLVGLMRPSFFLLNGEVRALGAGGLGPPVVSQGGGALAPLGLLGNGDPVVAIEDFDEDDSDETCTSELFTIAAATGQRRALDFGGCGGERGLSLPWGGAAVVGDRVYAVVERNGADEDEFPPNAVVSVRGDGTGRRDHARGTYRSPEAVATDTVGRLTWWQPNCTGGTEIVTEDQPSSAGVRRVAPCSVKVLTRSARVRGRHITLRVRCAHGCRGTLTARHGRRTRFLRTYASEAGAIKRLRLRLNRRERRAARLRLTVSVSFGRERTAVIRLR